MNSQAERMEIDSEGRFEKENPPPLEDDCSHKKMRWQELPEKEIEDPLSFKAKLLTSQPGVEQVFSQEKEDLQLTSEDFKIEMGASCCRLSYR